MIVELLRRNELTDGIKLISISFAATSSKSMFSIDTWDFKFAILCSLLFGSGCNNCLIKPTKLSDREQGSSRTNSDTKISWASLASVSEWIGNGR